MLLDNFYKVLREESAGRDILRAEIAFVSGHDIFKGHFPGLPVVPGVCMMAIVKEVLERGTGRTLTLEKTAQIKFLSLINPLEHEKATVEIKYTTQEDAGIVAECVILVAGNPFFKMARALYR